MNDSAQKFIECLEEAENMLEDHLVPNTIDDRLKLEHMAPDQEHFNLALLEQWSDHCDPEELPKPPIRIIQHLSCTGGTVISRCIAAMPNVSLLSEVNPLTEMVDIHRSGFAPTDLTYLARQIDFPLMDDLSIKLFKSQIEIIFDHARQMGRYLVLREHSHSNFHVDNPFKEKLNIRAILENENKLLAIVTVRHPVDSYLSILSNGWVRFEPPTFDEYCRRYLMFMESNKSLPIFKYEDFVDDPVEQLKLICETLALPLNEDFQEIFDLNALSGDSGRSSNRIDLRARRDYDQDLYNEIGASASYAKLCKSLQYDPSLTEPSVPSPEL